MSPRPRWLPFAVVVVAVAFAVSGVAPHDRLTWLMEVAPVVLIAPVLWLTRDRFPLSDLLYACIAVHALVLIYGAAYTYARVPLGFVLQDGLDLARNPYDRIGHFFQGFVPALAAREILLRGAWVRGPRMRAFLVLCVALAVSAAYELVEWAAALGMGQGASQFLGTQGDPWDTQADMFMALLGALVVLTLLARLHDRRIAALASRAAGNAGGPDAGAGR